MRDLAFPYELDARPIPTVCAHHLSTLPTPEDTLRVSRDFRIAVVRAFQLGRSLAPILLPTIAICHTVALYAIAAASSASPSSYDTSTASSDVGEEAHRVSSSSSSSFSSSNTTTASSVCATASS
jgi:hypothetical protein